jgi:hypothetical protein
LKQPIVLRQWILKIGNVLSLGKLEAFPRALLSVLLAFLDPGIAGNETGVFQCRT